MTRSPRILPALLALALAAPAAADECPPNQAFDEAMGHCMPAPKAPPPREDAVPANAPAGHGDDPISGTAGKAHAPRRAAPNPVRNEAGPAADPALLGGAAAVPGTAEAAVAEAFAPAAPAVAGDAKPANPAGAPGAVVPGGPAGGGPAGGWADGNWRERAVTSPEILDKAIGYMKKRLSEEHGSEAAVYLRAVDMTRDQIAGSVRDLGLKAGNIALLGRMIDREVVADRAKAVALANPDNALAQKQWQDASGRLTSAMTEVMGAGPGATALHNTYHQNYLTIAPKDGGVGSMTPDDKTKHNDGMIANSPRNPMPILFDGNLALANGDSAAAAARANQALALDPSNSKALALRAAASFSNHDFSAAAADARAALRFDPNDQRASAILKFSEGRGGAGGGSASAGSGSGAGSGAAGAGSGSAGGAFASVGAGGGGSAGALTASAPGAAASASSTREAMASLSLRDYSASISRASRAIELNPANAQAFNLRAIAYNKTGRFRDALRDAEAGLKLDPRNGALLNTKAYAQNKLKMFRDALESANAALEGNPRDANAFRLRAEALGGLGDRAGMVEALRQAAALDSRYQATLEQALQLPADADTAFLFADEEGPGRAGGSAGGSGAARRFGLVAGAAVIGGFLVALGLLQVLLPPLKSAWTRVTSRGSPVSASAVAPVPTPSPRNATPVPALLRGQYQTIRQIGIGGMGMVYEGTDVSLGRKVAIKRMRDEIRSDKRERERFITEAKLVAALHHPHIVDIYAIVEEGDDTYLIFEYIPGRTVHEIVAERGRLPWNEALAVFRGVCRALEYSHGRNIIHRDLKPSNIMVSEEGFVKVMDFGIARLAKDAMNRFSMTNTVVGTPPYMAPEQEQGVVRRESDLYALAICLYEMICGVSPFQGTGAGMLMNKINNSYPPPSSVVDGLPSGMDDIFKRALDPDPEKRFHSAREMLSAFEDLAPHSSRAHHPAA